MNNQVKSADSESSAIFEKHDWPRPALSALRSRLILESSRSFSIGGGDQIRTLIGLSTSPT